MASARVRACSSSPCLALALACTSPQLACTPCSSAPAALIWFELGVGLGLGLGVGFEFGFKSGTGFGFGCGFGFGFGLRLGFGLG